MEIERNKFMNTRRKGRKLNGKKWVRKNGLIEPFTE